LLGPPTLLWRGVRLRRRVGDIARGHDGLVARHEGGAPRVVDARLAWGPRGRHLVLDLPQQRLQVGSPGLLVVLLDRGQFAQVMRVAQRVGAVELPVGLQSVMHADAVEGGQDADHRHRHAAPLGMHRIMRQPRRTRHMHPLQRAVDTHPCLVIAPHVRADQGVLDLIFHPYEARGTGLDRRLQGPFRGRVPERVPPQRARAVVRQQVRGQQIHRQRLDPHPVRHRCGDVGGKRSCAGVPTAGTHLLLGALLTHLQPQRTAAGPPLGGAHTRSWPPRPARPGTPPTSRGGAR